MPGSDYINASFVNVRKCSYILCSYSMTHVLVVWCQGYKEGGAYIATQCPLKNTMADFWRMVNEFQCGCVVMLQEEGEVIYLHSSLPPYSRCAHYIVGE
jgi:protein tyrosine phosphatase